MSRVPEDLACAVDPEPGRELQFCPIRQLPIVRGQRVRTLPGFHLLCLDAGKEALARGSYNAFGKQFPCQNLEYLHTDDKIFICPEDHKAFLNQMSMQYHRYICHELEERKEERKRLRARAAERKARSEAHAAQAQQRQQQLLQSQKQAETVGEQGVQSVEGASAAALAGADAAAQLLATGDVEVAEDPLVTAIDDPYATTAAGEDPYLDAAVSGTDLATSPAAPSSTPAATPAASVLTSLDLPSSAGGETANTTPAAAAPSQQAPQSSQVPDEEDLYGDIGEREAKRQRTTTTYASAMGAILGDDFDEDEG